MPTARKTQSLPNSKDLNPTEISELSELLGPPSLLHGESDADYEALKMRIMAAVKPVDAIEHLYVRDVIDLQWDLLRFRRLKAHLLSSSAPSGLAALMAARKYTHFNDARFASWFNNEPKAVKEIKALLTQWGLSEQDIYAQTMFKKINEFERLEKMAYSVEMRRNTALRELERHREAVARRLRDAVAIEDAT